MGKAHDVKPVGDDGQRSHGELRADARSAARVEAAGASKSRPDHHDSRGAVVGHALSRRGCGGPRPQAAHTRSARRRRSSAEVRRSGPSVSSADARTTPRPSLSATAALHQVRSTRHFTIGMGDTEWRARAADHPLACFRLDEETRRWTSGVEVRRSRATVRCAGHTLSYWSGLLSLWRVLRSHQRRERIMWARVAAFEGTDVERRARRGGEEAS